MSGRGERKKDTVLVSEACCEDLANAIVVQAVNDYLAAFKALQSDPDNFRAKRMQKEVLAFLKSEWYQTLTNVNPRVLIQHLENKTGTDIDF